MRIIHCQCFEFYGIQFEHMNEAPILILWGIDGLRGFELMIRLEIHQNVKLAVPREFR